MRGGDHRAVPGDEPPVAQGRRNVRPGLPGVIETDDGAALLFDMRGYGRAYPKGARQIVVSVTHISDDDRYRRLNDVVAVGVGEVRSAPDTPTELVIDVSELIWEPIAP